MPSERQKERERPSVMINTASFARLLFERQQWPSEGWKSPLVSLCGVTGEKPLSKNALDIRCFVYQLPSAEWKRSNMYCLSLHLFICCLNGPGDWRVKFIPPILPDSGTIYSRAWRRQRFESLETLLQIRSWDGCLFRSHLAILLLLAGQRLSVASLF